MLSALILNMARIDEHNEAEKIVDQIQKAKDMRKPPFRNLLRTVLKDFSPIKDKPFVVINLGCRRGEDSDDIAICCNELAWSLKHIAIDCDGDAIASAVADNSEINTTYIHDNAVLASCLAHYPDNVDLIMLRHPEIWCYGESMWERNEDIWFEMVKHAWSKSHANSQVLITTYNEREFKLVVNTFKHLQKAVITTSSINPYRDTSLTRWNHRTDTENCPDHYLVRIKKTT